MLHWVVGKGGGGGGWKCCCMGHREPIVTRLVIGAKNVGKPGVESAGDSGSFPHLCCCAKPGL